MRKRDVFGLVSIIGGIILVVLGVPVVPGYLTGETLQNLVLNQPRAYVYGICLVVFIIVLKLFEKRYAKKHELYYLTLCALTASITIIGGRGWSSMIKIALERTPLAATRANGTDYANDDICACRTICIHACLHPPPSAFSPRHRRPQSPLPPGRQSSPQGGGTWIVYRSCPMVTCSTLGAMLSFGIPWRTSLPTRSGTSCSSSFP